MTKVNGTKFDEIRNKISMMTDLMVSISKDWDNLSEEDKEKLEKAYNLEKDFRAILFELTEFEGNLYDEDND